MANQANVCSLTSAIAKGRGLRIDNEDGELFMINHDGSTTVTITPSRLKRVSAAQFFDWDGGNPLAPTVSGIGKYKTALTVTGLAANVKGILVVLKGSRS
jgi:hypothetical protein